MFFFLLALLAYCAYVRRHSVGRYLGVTCLFALALMSKPQVITFPCVLLLLDFWPLRRTREFAGSPNAESPVNRAGQESLSRLLLEKVPWFALSALSAVITMLAQHAGNAVRTTVEYSLASRMETAITSYVLYLRDVFFPRHLAPIYPHAPNLIAIWTVLLALLLLVAISVVAIASRKRRPYLIFGWLWFLGTLVPMIGLVQVGEQGRADRYMYISLIGILVACVWGVTELFDRHHVSISLRAL